MLLLVVLAVIGGIAVVATGRWGGLPDAEPERSPRGELAADGEVDRPAVDGLRFSLALRGYRMDEVDWLLDRLSEQVDSRDREIARLRSVLHVEPVTGDGEPELLTHPLPAVRDVDRPRDGEGGRPHRVPEGTEVTDARPDRPAREFRTTGRGDAE